jgi:hypothetical protein
MKYLADEATPPKPFNEFLNENTKIQTLERIFIMLINLFKNLKIKFDFSGKGKEDREKAMADLDDKLLAAGGISIKKEKESTTETNKLKEIETLLDKDGWNNVNIQGFCDKDGEYDKNIAKQTLINSDKKEVDRKFLEKVLRAEGESVLGIARTKGLNLETLKLLKEAEDEDIDKNALLKLLSGDSVVDQAVKDNISELRQKKTKERLNNLKKRKKNFRGRIKEMIADIDVKGIDTAEDGVADSIIQILSGNENATPKTWVDIAFTYMETLEDTIKQNKFLTNLEKEFKQLLETKELEGIGWGLGDDFISLKEATEISNLMKMKVYSLVRTPPSK